MLEARGLRVDIGGSPILLGVDLKVRYAEMVALCGPNGAGKSTLVAAMSGDLVPTKGLVSIDGTIVSDLKASELANRRAVLEQTPTVTAGFTVRELLSLSIPRQISPSDTSRIIHEILVIFGLAERINDSCLSLSGGERHRAHFARVFAQLAVSDRDRAFLLLDEPTAGLDLAYQVSAMQIAREVARAGFGVMVVLHDLNLAAAFADRIALMHAGRLVAEGAIEEVFTEERLSIIYNNKFDVSNIPGEHMKITPVYERKSQVNAIGRILMNKNLSGKKFWKYPRKN